MTVRLRVRGNSLPAFRAIAAVLWSSTTRKSAELPIRRHVESAIAWICTAHLAADDGGISKGYSLLRGRWEPSYPETTGYTIPTLLNAAKYLGDSSLKPLAISLADYLVGVATQEGGVAHFRRTENPSPIVFDTGQTILGLLAAFEASRDKKYLAAAVRAGEWIVAMQDSSGSWKRHQHLDMERVIDSRVAWALLRLYEHTQLESFRGAATRNIAWVLDNQDGDGWFRRCSLVENEDPLTHTIAYAAEGLLECGRLLFEPAVIEAARLTADALLSNQRIDGGLSATFARGWRGTSKSSCLTGDCQVAHLWLKLNELEPDTAYTSAAIRAIRFVARTQDLSNPDANIRGAIAGSEPIYGRYERMKYPNWAVKFFVDASIAYEGAKTPEIWITFVG